MAGSGQHDDGPSPGDSSLGRNQATPSPRPVTLASVEEALRRLDLSADDRAELLDRIAAVGRPDPVMNERVGVDRRTMEEARERPLTRTESASLPTRAERASAFVETFYLPSGRLFQLRRRFPSQDELHRVMGSPQGFEQPALWVREIRLPAGLEELPSVVWVEAVTVQTEDEN